MRVFSSRSADGAWKQAANSLTNRNGAVEVASRRGKTVELLHCAFEISDPRRRWVVSRHPPLNVAFALAEVVWIMAGRDDVRFLRHWNSKYPQFVGTTARAHGAYGWRLRKQFGVDQLDRARRALERNPQSRQVVLDIWSANDDLPYATGRPRAGDVPCNLMACLRLANGKLEWMQFCRSNDIFLGFPHNVIQFTYLQEILAGWIGVDVGRYVHVVSSLHMYLHDLDHYGIAHPAPSLPPPLDVRLPWRQSQTAWGDLARAANGLIKRSAKTRRPPKTHRSPSLPPALEAIYHILSAEDARRRGWPDEADSIAALCQDSLFLALWRRWLQRLRVQEHTLVRPQA